jgi:hypothetical protein
MAVDEGPHRVFVRELHNGSVDADREHRLNVLRRDPRNHAEFRMLLLDAVDVSASEPRDGCHASPSSSPAGSPRRYAGRGP